MIFSAYRRDEFADPDAFVLQLGMVLERFPDAVIREVSHPYTGIQRKCKFPPSIAEVVELCEYHAERNERIAELSKTLISRDYAARPIERFNLSVAKWSATYDRIVKAVESGKIESRQEEHHICVNYHDYLSVVGRV